MHISFFEEYPSEDNLSKLGIVPFPTSIYLACRNVGDFLNLQTRIKEEHKNVQSIVYWPILDLSEGYWISAFSKTKAIRRIFNELSSTEESFPVLLDAEVPTLNKKLFFTEIFHVPRNRSLIRKAVSQAQDNHPLIVAAFPRHGVIRFLSQLAGISFPFNNYHRLEMLYTSLLKIRSKEGYVRRVIQESSKKFTK